MKPRAPTALIAEDEPLLAQALRAELALVWPELRVVATVGNGIEAVREALALQPEVLFLDIRMPGLSGLEAAAELADAWPGEGAGARKFPSLVFVTAYDQYAVQAFEAQAADYVLKPVQSARLQKTVDKLKLSLGPTASDASGWEAGLAQLRGLLATESSVRTGGPLETALLRVLQIGVGNAIQMVPVQEVVYLEAADKYVRVLTPGHEHLVRTPLKDLLPRLDPEDFWQIHRGTVVQARHIARVTRDEAGKLHLSLRNRPEKLAVSRLYAYRFKAL